VTTTVQIRAAAQALCFRACTDCKSADECEPDDNWIEEARAALEVDKIKSKSKPANPRDVTFFSFLIGKVS
jgi:methylphosphotriester-DNA--protein-cysteine methyltransferase